MHPPLFTRILDEKTSSKGIQIPEAQLMYQNFWNMLTPLCNHCPERMEALRKLQESCMWFTRAIAASAWYEEHPQPKKKPIQPKKLPLKPDFKRANSVKKVVQTDIKYKPKLPTPPHKQYGEFNLGMADKFQKAVDEVNQKNEALYADNLNKQVAPVVKVKRK